MASETNRLRELFDSGRPNLAASYADDVDVSTLAAARDAGLDVVELRIDRYASWDLDHVVARVQQARSVEGIAVLATVRWTGEGGEREATHAERAAIYEAILPFVDGIDVELASVEASTELASTVLRARTLGVVVLLSTHDFEALPDPDALEDIRRRSMDSGADVAKIAAMTRSDLEVRSLAAFTIGHAEEGVIVIAMGEHGTKSRVFFPALGSLLTFATAPGAPVVSGQLSFDDTVAELARFYPTRK